MAIFKDNGDQPLRLERADEFRVLVIKYMKEGLTSDEQERLNELIAESQHFRDTFEKLTQQSSLREAYQELLKFKEEWDSLPRSLEFQAKGTHPAGRVRFLKTTWFKYAAAVILLVGAAVTSVVVFSGRRSQQQPIVNGNNHLQTDIPPGGEKAILTLADGSKIVLDNAANGNLAQQGNSQVVKLSNGQIAYNLKGASDTAVMWNTMTTPAGGQYQVTLPDGTKVWLNAASSITYPTAFVGKRRIVKISGEVYCEVTVDRQKPFTVDVDGKSSVHVLGTSFNINSYGDEGNIKATLLNGGIKVVQRTTTAATASSDRQSQSTETHRDRSQAVVLKAGQQAILKNGSDILIVNHPDIDQTLAWKNGLFNFTGLNVRQVMSQLERWYDIKVQYEGEVPGFTFRGEMHRNANLSKVLKMLEKMEVKFRMEGKTLIVL